MSKQFGRETVQLVEIDQPLCSRRYGDLYSLTLGGVYIQGNTLDDYFARGGKLNGIEDSKKGTFAAWVNFQSGGDAVSQGIFNASSNFFRINRLSSNVIHIEAKDAGGTPMLYMSSNSTVSTPSGWLHIAMSWDVGLSLLRLRLNGADDLNTGTATSSNLAVGYSVMLDWFVSRLTSTTYKFNGYIAQLYFNSAEFVDLDDPDVMAKLYNGGQWMHLGADGSALTGSQPIVFLDMRATDAPTVFGVNKGYGGDFMNPHSPDGITLAPSVPSGPAGGAACAALLGATGVAKCFNTRFTCQDPANYLPETQIIRFSKTQPEIARYYDNVIPLFNDASVTSASINPGAMDENASALGQREVADLLFDDMQHSDVVVDPYRAERATGEASLIAEGTVPASSPPVLYTSTLQLDSLASMKDDEYKGRTLQITAGPGSPQQQEILEYSGEQQLASVFRWGAPYYLELEGELPAYVFQAEDLGAGIASVDLIWGGYDLVMNFSRGGSDVATTIDRNGKIILVDPDSPRFCYHPGTLEPLGFLPEGQSTNRCTNSWDLSAGTWTPQHATVALTSEYAPDGTLTAYKLYEDSVSGVEHNIVSNDVTITADETISASVFLKPLEREWFMLTFTRNSQLVRVWVNASTGAVGSSTVSGTGAVLYDVKMRYFAKYGYYRAELFFILGGGETVMSSTFSPVPGDGIDTFAGDGASGGIIWGNQVERRRGCTSYMPTSGAEVTRNVDALYFTGFSIGAEVTIFTENYRWQGGDPNNGTFNAAIVGMDDGTGANTLWVFQSSNNFLALQTNVSSVLQINYGVSNVLAYGQHQYRTMSRWSPGDHAGVVARDGVAGAVVYNTNASALPSVNVLRIGTHISAGAGSAADSPIRRIVIWNKAMSDATMSAFVVNESLSWGNDFPTAFPTDGSEYRVTDAYDPEERGTFWGKWIARNPYYTSYTVRLYTGALGQDISEMDVRYYVIDRVEGPSGGTVKIVAKDMFSLIERSKAVVPSASRCQLTANISASDTSFSVDPTDAEILDEDYPIPAESPPRFYVRIGDECIQVTRSGATFSVVARGALGTTANTHSQDDVVQFVQSFVQMEPHEIMYLLFTQFSVVPASWINKAEWDDLAQEVTQLYTAYITEPTPIADLLGELCQHARFTLWPDVANSMVKLSNLRPKASKLTIGDSSWVMEDKISVTRRNERRLTEVWVYYGRRNQVEKLDERTNYASVAISSDPEAEELYGAAKIREVYSRWIPQFGRQEALSVGDGMLSMFRDPPREVELTAPESRAGEVSLSDVVSVMTDDVQNVYGESESFQTIVTEIAEGSEESIDLKLLGFRLFESDAAAVQDKTIYIENDIYNANLRDIFDSLYATPEPMSPPITIKFVIGTGVSVGSVSIASYALVSGDWSDIVATKILEVVGRIEGCGGQGGSSVFPLSNAPGHPGGNALYLTADFLLTGSGKIWAGGGGGAAGYGCEGGGGAGVDPGSSAGNPGTPDAGGAGQTYGISTSGAGGGPGQSGGNSYYGSNLWAVGGAAGLSIVGYSHASFDSPNLLDIRGATS